MSANEYHFVTAWRVEATVEEVSAILGDPLALVRWWPSVYLDVREIEPGSADGTGRVVELLTKGRLPYRLRWRFRVTESRRPYGFALEAWAILWDAACGCSSRTEPSRTSRTTGRSWPRSLFCGDYRS